jgi:soluble lytic murein transglycosylase-like protein
VVVLNPRRRLGASVAGALLLGALVACSSGGPSADGALGGGAPGAGPPSAAVPGGGVPGGDSGPGACPSAAEPDPAALVCQLRVADAVVHDPAATPAALADAGRRAEDAYRTLGDHPEWDSVALGALDPLPRAQARRVLEAYRALVELDGPPPATLPAWRVVDPLPAQQLRGYYTDAQRRYGVPWTVLAAVHLVETRMGKIVGVSPAGAQGPMQFIPATWARYGLGGNVWDNRDAITGAANYLAANGGATPGGLDRALKRYNNDVRYVRAVRAYAAMMDADPRAFLGLHAWPVRYRTVAGDVPLDAGYAADRRIPVAEWLAAHPIPSSGR